MQTKEGDKQVESTAKERKSVVKEFMALNRLHRRMVENRLNQTGVYRAQHHLLMYISEHEGCSQTELAQGTGITTPSVAVSLKKLEKGGYLKRVVDGEDNRYHKVVLTEKGREIVKQSHEIFDELDEQLLCGMNSEELMVFTNFLKRMQNNIQDVAGKSEGDK